MRYRPRGSAPADHRLGRFIPDDDRHISKYPLTVATMPQAPVPVVIGVGWYSDFDTPVQDSKGRYWIGKDPKNLGAIRGGHCVVIPSDPAKDLKSWWDFYNQGKQGSCVGYGASRMMSMLNRKRYDARWLWDRAKETDEWTETNPGDDNGTSVRAALEVLRVKGHKRSRSATEDVQEGIAAYRWARSANDALFALQNPLYARLGAVPIKNSWGKSYPRTVWLPLETLDRLIQEDGEVGVIVDK